MWRNWQTRMIQVHVGRPVQVQVLLSALKIPEDDSGIFNFHDIVHNEVTEKKLTAAGTAAERYS